MLVVPLRGKRLPSGSRLHVELDKRNAGLHHADRVDVACVPGLVDCRYELAALREIATSALEHEIPLLSILAVPGPLAPHSDLALFEHDVQASIRRSARTGSLDEFAHTLRTPNTLHRCSL